MTASFSVVFHSPEGLVGSTTVQSIREIVGEGKPPEPRLHLALQSG